jgi:autotransporter translocation and assembly factor TamB
LVGQLKSRFLPVLPVDVIKVGLAKTNVTGAEDTRFEAGKNLTERLYVSYVYQLGNISGLRRLNRNQFQLEYRFAHHLGVEATFGDNSVGSLNLYWDRRF